MSQNPPTSSSYINEFGSIISRLWPRGQWFFESNTCCRMLGRGHHSEQNQQSARLCLTSASHGFNAMNFLLVCIATSSMFVTSSDLPLIGDHEVAVGIRSYRDCDDWTILHDMRACPDTTHLPQEACDGCIEATVFPIVVMLLHVILLPYIIWMQCERCTPLGDYNCAKNVLSALYLILASFNAVALAFWLQLCYARMGPTVELQSGVIAWLMTMMVDITVFLLNCYLGTPSGRNDPTREDDFVQYLMKSVKKPEEISVKMPDSSRSVPIPSSTQEKEERTMKDGKKSSRRATRFKESISEEYHPSVETSAAEENNQHASPRDNQHASPRDNQHASPPDVLYVKTEAWDWESAPGQEPRESVVADRAAKLMKIIEPHDIEIRESEVVTYEIEGIEESFYFDRTGKMQGKVVDEGADMGYVYVDQKGQIQGPQPLKVLYSWYNDGKLPRNLIVRRVDWAEWSTLSTVLWGA